MDEQRLQAYAGLIKQILDCSPGQEVELLQKNRELVDDQLWIVMEQASKVLESRGDPRSGWMQNFPMQLMELSEIGRQQELEGTPDIEISVKFLRETFLLIADSQGNSQQIYAIWAKHLEYFDHTLLPALSYTAGQFLLSIKEEKQRAAVAAVWVNFGNLISYFRLGTCWLNQEVGISAYLLALKVYNRHSFPKDWAMTQHNLANVLSNRIRGKRAENLEQAIEAYQLALQVRTCEAFPEKWAMTQASLAGAYFNRIRGERTENLELAIEASQLALQVYTRDALPEDWAMTQHNLANAYANRIRGERAENLEQAIKAYQLALQVRTRDALPEDWAMTQHNLANAYANRIRGERAENLEQAIKAYQLALQVRTHDALPEQWAMTQNSLTIAYVFRIQGERSENLEQAIETSQFALQVYTRDAFPEDWAMAQNNLANAYANRIRGERSENLEQAIEASQFALQVYTQDSFPEQWAMTQGTLANAYANRIRGERSENLEQAIEAYQLALQVHTRDAFPEQWAMTQINLANAYANRIRGERSENLEQAIEAYQLALQVHTRDAFPEQWARAQNNLANAYTDRIQGDRAENLELAIKASQLALQVHTRDAFPEDWARAQNNLANAYTDRIRGEQVENLEQAVASFELALQVYNPEEFPYAFPNACRQTSRNLGGLHFEQQNWDAARAAYSNALAAAEILYQSCILLDGKASELAETADLRRRLAYTLAQANHLAEAVETLEQGRARGLSENLDRDRADLTQLQQQNHNLCSQYQDLTQQLRNLEAQQRDRATSSDRHSITPETLRNEAIRLRQQLSETIDQIHHQPGYETFLRLPTFADVQQAANGARPLIYLLTTSAGSLALIVTPDTTKVVWLDNFTETQLSELLQDWFAAYNKSQGDRQGWFDEIDHVTQKLWQPLMAPLIDYLKQHSFQQATLIPTGYLSLLSLHAAWTEDSTTPTDKRYALDEIGFTYAPNARSLTAANAIVQQSKAEVMAAIDNPLKDLPNSSREVAAAIATFPQPKVLKQEEATVESVLAALPDCNLLHLSCHGTANLREPLNSGLSMNDGLLTLRQIFDLRLNDQCGIRLVVLSACETGLVGTELADEAISLPTGLLQAGVAGVIASLWSVSDLSTMLLLSKFYELWRTENQEPSEALRQAQIWLRDSTDGEIANSMGLFTPTPDNRSYAHPFHWAAFSYTGV